MKELIALFFSFFQIGLLSFGGGYAAMPLIREQVVELHGWLSMQQFADIITIAEMTPGPIAVNSATFVGIQIAGLPGAIIATLGCIAPACIIVTLLGAAYYKYKGLSLVKGVLSGLRPAVIAMILSAGLSLFNLATNGNKAFFDIPVCIDYLAIDIFILAFIILRVFKINPIYAIAGSGVLGVVLYGFVVFVL